MKMAILLKHCQYQFMHDRVLLFARFKKNTFAIIRFSMHTCIYIYICVYVLLTHFKPSIALGSTRVMSASLPYSIRVVASNIPCSFSSNNRSSR